MNFKDYVNEGSIKTSNMKKVDVDVLSPTAKSDLINVLMDEVKFLKSDPSWWFDDVWQELFDLIDPPKIKVGYADPVSLKKKFGKNRGTSDLAVQVLYDKIMKGTEMDPVFIAKDKFVDGGHRVEAYIKAGKKKMPVADIHSLLKMDWKKWTEGEELEN